MPYKDLITGENLELRSTPEFQNEIQEFDKQLCLHEVTKRVRYSVSGGGTQIKDQCQVCGEPASQAISQKLITGQLPDANIDLRKNYLEKRRIERNAIYRKHENLQRQTRTDRQKEYDKYLAGPVWKEKRERVLIRAKRVCEGCGIAAAEEVHHLNYKRIFNEMLFDLVAVCADCHRKLHQGFDENIETQVDDEQINISAVEDRCSSCRYQAFDDNAGFWCGALGMPATQAQSSGGECKTAYEPLK